jgi:hypothetical protein
MIEGSGTSMNGKLQRWLSGLAILALPVTAVAAAPDATTEFVYDMWYANEYARIARVLRSDNARMDLEIRDTQDRMAIKERVVADLIAGRLSLDAAIDRFLEVNGDRQMEMISVVGTNEEKAAASLLTYISSRDPAALPPLAEAYASRFGRPFLEKMMRD